MWLVPYKYRRKKDVAHCKEPGKGIAIVKYDFILFPFMRFNSFYTLHIIKAGKTKAKINSYIRVIICQATDWHCHHLQKKEALWQWLPKNEYESRVARPSYILTFLITALDISICESLNVYFFCLTLTLFLVAAE